MIRGIFVLLGAVIMAGTLAAQAAAEGKYRWEKIGCVEAKAKTTRQVMEVGTFATFVKGVRVAANGDDIDIEHVVAEFGNGDTAGIKLPYVLAAGTQSKAHDFGKDKLLTKLHFAMKRTFKTKGKGAASLCAFAWTSMGLF